MLLGVVEDYLGVERSIALPIEVLAPDAPSRLSWQVIRRVLIMLLGVVEKDLGVERSIVPRHKRPRRREHL
jgi:hypothetical protein